MQKTLQIGINKLNLQLNSHTSRESSCMKICLPLCSGLKELRQSISKLLIKLTLSFWNIGPCSRLTVRRSGNLKAPGVRRSTLQLTLLSCSRCQQRWITNTMLETSLSFLKSSPSRERSKESKSISMAKRKQLHQSNLKWQATSSRLLKRHPNA